jgi:hypothetical protein
LVEGLRREYKLDINKVGLNVVISRTFIYVMVLDTPYHIYADKALYLEPWSLIGFYTLPVLDRLWPNTKNIDQCNIKVEFERPLDLFNVN